jgi:UDP-N-acetylmuramate dehydrogenase
VQELIKKFENIKSEVQLASYTTWKIGGPATYFWEPDAEQLPEVLSFCKINNIKVYFLGRGSNVLISSKGLEGLVICTKRSFQEIVVGDDGIIMAQGGVPMPKLSSFASKLGYGGYEYLIGIPGSIGAGIAINAGLTAHGRREIGDVLLDVELMDKEGNVWKEKAEDMNLGYRSSNIIERGLFVLSARFKATYEASAAEIREKTLVHLKERRRKQPLSKATAGSTFKQPEGGKPAGWYIDQAGLKGYQIGGAKVNEKHANWIENIGSATSADVVNLMSYITEQVKRKFDIYLEKEVKYFE